MAKAKTVKQIAYTIKLLKKKVTKLERLKKKRAAVAKKGKKKKKRR